MTDPRGPRRWNRRIWRGARSVLTGVAALCAVASSTGLRAAPDDAGGADSTSAGDAGTSDGRTTNAPPPPTVGEGPSARDGGADRRGDQTDRTIDGTTARDGGAADGPPVTPVTPVTPPPALAPVRLRVLEKGTRRPLGGTTITVDAQPAGETDADGRLTVALPPGSHQVEAQFPGHQPLRRPVDVTAEEAVLPGELILRLVPQSTGERFVTEVRSTHAEKPRISVEVEEARQTAGTSGDPVRVLASLPGVSQVVWPAALFVVRGSNPGNTGFFIDGIRVPATFHLGLGPSLLNPSLIGGLDFYPGAYPENFGRYVAGIVSIRTAPPPTDRAHLAADVTLYDASAIGTAPLDDGRGSVAAAARYSYTGPLLSLFDPTTRLRYGDYQLRFDHTLAGGHATIFAFGSLDELDWSGVTFQNAGSQTDATQTAALQFHRLDFRWTGGVGGGRLVAGVTGGYDAARSTLSQIPLSITAVDLAPRLLWTRPLGSSWDLELGADAELQHFTAHPEPFAGTLSDLARSRPAVSQGTFAALRLHPIESLVVTPGLRGDLFAEENTSRFALEPRLDARLTLTSAWILKANAGRFSQMPSLPVNIAGFESFGLASIGLQSADNVSAGVETRLPADLAVEVTGFYQRMRVTDLINTDLRTAMVAEQGFLVLHNGVGYGLETMIRRPATHRLYGWLAYTLSYSLRNGPMGVVRSDWDQRHILNLVTGYRIGGAYTVSTRVHFNTGRNVPLYTGNGDYRQTPAYYQLDLRAERRILFDRFVLDVFIDVANATFNRELIEYVSTGPNESEPSYLRIALPTIGLHGEF